MWLDILMKAIFGWTIGYSVGNLMFVIYFRFLCPEARELKWTMEPLSREERRAFHKIWWFRYWRLGREPFECNWDLQEILKDYCDKVCQE